MNLQAIIARLAAIDEEVRAASTAEAVDALATEKQELLTRKAELEALEQRKQTAMGLTAGTIPGAVVDQRGRATEPEDRFDTPEYRRAFQRFIQRGAPIPVELRTGDESTVTADVATVIPTTIANTIIEKIEALGMILPLITRTSYATGVNLPTSTVRPVATWVNEGASSDRQKKTTSYVTFSKHKLRCEISLSAEVGAMALSAFEASFVRQVSEAMVKAIESKIVSTDVGTANVRGILAETPTTGQALTANTLTYDTLINAEAALPQQYEAGAVWCMTKKTFMAFVGMTDAEGQPIARTTYGIGGIPERTLLGRPVALCGDYLDSFASTLTTGKIFAFIFNFRDYVLNTVYDMGIQRKQDWDTEDWLTKAVMSVDGKVVDVSSLVTIAKSACRRGA